MTFGSPKITFFMLTVYSFSHKNKCPFNKAVPHLQLKVEVTEKKRGQTPQAKDYFQPQLDL